MEVGSTQIVDGLNWLLASVNDRAAACLRLGQLSNLAGTKGPFLGQPSLRARKGRANSNSFESALETESDAHSLNEFNQVIAAILTAASRYRDDMLSASAFGDICLSGDRFSSNLLRRSDPADRIILQNAAYLLGSACNGSWAERHRRVLLDDGVEPDAWVTFLLTKLTEKHEKPAINRWISR